MGIFKGLRDFFGITSYEENQKILKDLDISIESLRKGRLNYSKDLWTWTVPIEAPKTDLRPLYLKFTILSIKEKPYCWFIGATCQSGHLVRVVNSITEEELMNYVPECWVNNVTEYREEGTHKLSHLLDKVYEVGFTPEDIINLERLSDPKVRKMAGMSPLEGQIGDSQRTKIDTVIRYLEGWVSLLEEKIPDIK